MELPFGIKVFYVLFCAYIIGMCIINYMQGGFRQVITNSILPYAIGGILGYALVYRTYLKEIYRIHIKGGIKFFWCMFAHGIRNRERTGQRWIEAPSIIYETRCKKCGIIDCERVIPFDE